MFFSENACCYCQPLSSTLPVTLLFVHPLAEMLKCCFCGSEGASMTDFHDLQLKEQLLLQQKWEDDVDVDEGNLFLLGKKKNSFFFCKLSDKKCKKLRWVAEPSDKKC